MKFKNEEEAFKVFVPFEQGRIEIQDHVSDITHQGQIRHVLIRKSDGGLRLQVAIRTSHTIARNGTLRPSRDTHLAVDLKLCELILRKPTQLCLRNMCTEELIFFIAPNGKKN